MTNDQLLSDALRYKVGSKYIKEAKDVVAHHSVHQFSIYQSRKEKANKSMTAKHDKLMVYDERLVPHSYI